MEDEYDPELEEEVSRIRLEMLRDPAAGPGLIDALVADGYDRAELEQHRQALLEADRERAKKTAPTA
jgi:hypothetical protein